jgi:GNAT superfamily N-acetyltransferase
MKTRNDGVILKKAVPEDAAALSEIAFCAKAAWGYPAEWMEKWREDLTVTTRMIERGVARVAWLENTPVGFYLLNDQHETAHLEHLWVLPQHQRKGIGKLLLLDACQAARARGCDGVHIESDPNAESFYLHFGAIRLGVRPSAMCGEARKIPWLLLPL